MDVRLFHVTILLSATLYDGQTGLTAAIALLTDPKREGYARLMQDIKNHSIYTEKIPPYIVGPTDRAANNSEAIPVRLGLIFLRYYSYNCVFISKHENISYELSMHCLSLFISFVLSIQLNLS
jgi:hypothetical protein